MTDQCTAPARTGRGNAMLSAPGAKHTYWQATNRECAMTLAAGFVCGDGIVLGADSLYTGPAKIHGAKIWCVENMPVVLALAGAGNKVLIRKVWDEACRKLKPSMTEHEIVQMLEDTLYPLHIKHVKADKTGDTQLDVLVAIRTQAGLALFESDAHTLGRVDEKQCIGCGQSLARYLADWLFAPGMPVRGGRTIAAYVLERTKRYDPYCGGRSRIWVIPESGRPYQLTDAVIAELEAQLATVQDAMRKALVFAPGVVGEDINEATKRIRESTLQQVMKAAREIYIPISAAELGFKGTLTGVYRRRKTDDHNK